ncbi:glycosyltransferase [Acidipropionibacterium timonense]|uniref:glycosyltransferase n=1 Tax=Acidipropionibacterium timonense TaxID=2161818 RepID=UPI00102FB179|nr:glycosyltransferase [Acidipropionibacterium timonense]
MTIAIKLGFLDDTPIVDEDGHLTKRGAGSNIVERLMKMYPDSVVVGHEDRDYPDFKLRTLESLDAKSTLLINLDVIDSVGAFQILHREGDEPKILNFQWLPPSHYHHKVNFAAMGLSYALFPTLCAGERTAGEVVEIVRRWTIPPLAHQARVAWVQPGIRDDLLREHVDTEVPTVLYPSIHLNDTKQPKLFLDIVSRVADRVPLKMEARLGQRDLASVFAMKMSAPRWAQVGPLFGEREEYWESLARMTAFVATARDEAYGFEYMEALLAGAVGVLPRAKWAGEIVPEDYPYLYDDADHAVDLLEQVLRDPASARAKVDACADGSMREWILAHNRRSGGNDAIRRQVEEWFPEITG